MSCVLCVMSGILCPYCTTPLHSTTSLPISPYLSNFTPCDPNLNLSAAAGAAIIFPTVGWDIYKYLLFRYRV